MKEEKLEIKDHPYLPQLFRANPPQALGPSTEVIVENDLKDLILVQRNSVRIDEIEAKLGILVL